MTAAKPQVHVIGTGGSIAGVGPDRLDYMLYSELGDHLTIEQSLERVPEIRDFATVTSEDLVSVGSTAIGPADWLALTKRINGLLGDGSSLSGVAVTHGTATLEETSYFLHLTVKTDKPVVVTGAMRPPTAISTDADLNLMDAVRIAATPHAGGMGVLTVLNNEIHSGRDVSKSNTFRVETFRPNELGFLGYADSGPQGGVLPRAGEEAYDGDSVQRRWAGQPAKGGDRVLVCWGGWQHSGCGATDAAGRSGGRGVRRRHVSADLHRSSGPGGGGRHSGGAGIAVDGRPGGDDAPQGGAGLSGVRQPATAEGADTADAGPDREQ